VLRQVFSGVNAARCASAFAMLAGLGPVAAESAGGELEAERVERLLFASFSGAGAQSAYMAASMRYCMCRHALYTGHKRLEVEHAVHKG
jgi:hypothetical protein